MADDNEKNEDVAKPGNEPEPEPDSNLPAEIEAKIVEAVPTLLGEDRAKVVGIVSRYIHRGPIPPAHEMREYDNVIDDGANRIMAMAEREQAHRHTCETLAITYQSDVGRAKITESKRGQICGMVLAVLFCGASVYLAMHDRQVVAGILGGSTILGLVTAFVLGRRAQPSGGADDDGGEDEDSNGVDGEEEVVELRDKGPR